jgi:hypothetical protein
MMWLLLAWYFSGGSMAGGTGPILTSAGIAELRESAAVVVQDTSRRRNADAILKAQARDLKRFERTFADSGKRLDKLYLSHEDHRDAAMAILVDLNSAWEAGQVRALDARFALRDQLTEAEWSKLYSAGTRPRIQP